VGVALGDSSVEHSQVTQTSPDGLSSSSATTSVSGDSNADLADTIAKALKANPGLAAAAASVLGTGGSRDAAGGYNVPPPPTGGPGGFPGGFPIGGGFPFLPWGGGFGKGFHLNVDGGAGFGGLGAYYPVIEKVIVIVGGGILILLLIAFLQGSMAKGGFLNVLGGGFSKAVSGSFDLGPIHKSGAAAAAVDFDDHFNIGGKRLNDPHFNNQVNNAINHRF